MVNITHKSSTLRIAVASGIVKVSSMETIEAIKKRLVPKGDVFEFSRAAGLLACKKTYEVIPDCHPIPIEYASINYEINGLEITIKVEVHTIYKTGVEVEAMHTVTVVALTMYDMLKPIDNSVSICDIHLIEKKGGKSDFKLYKFNRTLKIGIITCSDSISRGFGEDISGSIIIGVLKKYDFPIEKKIVIPDNLNEIQEATLDLVQKGYDFIILNGGTGVSDRDNTPEAISTLLDKSIPGIMENARYYGQQRMPFSMLSRGVAGFIKNTLVVTLPGSPNGVKDSLNAIFPSILHCLKMKEGDKHF